MKVKVYSLLLPLLLLNVLHAQNIEALTQKANAGDTKAMMELAEAYRFGFGVEESADAADEWMTKAAEGGHEEAQYLVGLECMKTLSDQAKYDKGIGWLKASADSGYADANLKLREVYLDNGRDVTGNKPTAKYYSTKKAFEYGLAAANARSAQGAMFTGEALILGIGTEKNVDEGLEWLEKAAGRRKNTYAQLKLAGLYLDGSITGKPALFEAREWYNAAYTNEKSGFDEKIKADIGLSEVDKYFRNSHNLMMQSNVLLPAGGYFYPVR